MIHDHHASGTNTPQAPQPPGDHPSSQSLHVNPETSNLNPSNLNPQLERGVHREPGEVATSTLGHDLPAANGASFHHHNEAVRKNNNDDGRGGNAATNTRGNEVTDTGGASFHPHSGVRIFDAVDDAGRGRGGDAPPPVQGGGNLHNYNEVRKHNDDGRGPGGRGPGEVTSSQVSPLQAEGKGEGEGEGEGATTQQLMDLLGSDSEESVVSVDSFGEPYDASVGIMQRRVTAVRFQILCSWLCLVFAW
jgi:hypothetical protein